MTKQMTQDDIIRLGFLTTQQSMMQPRSIDPAILDRVQFFDVADTGRLCPFGIDDALAELQRELWEWVAEREKRKTEDRRLNARKIKQKEGV